MKIWKVKKDCENVIGNLVVKGDLCPCDGLQSVRAVAMRNTHGGWDDIHPLLIHKSNLDEINDIN